MFKTGGQSLSPEVHASVQKGDFQIDITTIGDLEAKSSVPINGPSGLMRARIYRVNLEKIIKEGTVVDSGDFVASLDKSEVMEKIKSAQTDLEAHRSEYQQAKMDTSLELREMRDKLLDLEYEVKVKEMEMNQAQYEPPAVKMKNERAFKKAKRDLRNGRENYKLKKRRAEAKVREAAIEMTRTQDNLDFLKGLLKNLRITAPEKGMLIYARNYRGEKLKEGSRISAFNPTVATLPDLSTMTSKTYVNEVDIRKVEEGQNVELGLDAFPEKKLTGEVTSVANVGQKRPNSDAKVFEVMVEINENDSMLRPGMTTSNTIITDLIPNAIYVALEALNSQGDSLNYVYTKNDMGQIVKKEVITGKMNTDEVIIKNGLQPGEIVYLSTPENAVDNKVARLDQKPEKMKAEIP